MTSAFSRRHDRWTIPILVAFVLSMCHTAQVYAAESEAIEEVVVTGTYIKRKNQQDVSSPIDTVGLEDIENNGWTDLEDVAETFTFNTSSWGRSGLRSGCCGTSRGIEIRGLGSSSTLVLQNGKRVASTATGANGADMTNIKALMPVIAIDRMETLLDGGAALYGSDAVAGVVNIIPRTDFEGFEVRTGGKQIEGSGQWELQMIAGAGNDRVHGMFAIGFEHQDSLRNAERDFSLINNTSGNGSPGTYFARNRPQNANGSDVIIDNGLNGAINYSALYDTALNDFLAADPGNVAADFAGVQYADPFCRPGIVPDIGPVPGGGQFSGTTFPLGTCRFSYQPNNHITPETNTLNLYTHWDISLGEHANLEFEYSGFRDEYRRGFIATFPMTNGRPVVPASNPANQLGTDLDWTGRPMGLAYGPTQIDGEGSAHRVAVTLNGDFGLFSGADWAQNWTFAVSAQYSADYIDGESPDSDLRRVQLALDGFGGANCDVRFDGPTASATPGQGNCYYFSPFAANIYNDTFDPNSGFGAVFQVDAAGNRVNVDEATVLDVLDYSILVESKSSSERTLRVLEGVVTGDIFELPGGTAGLALGYQNRLQIREIFETAQQEGLWQGFLAPARGGKGGINVDAFFAELYLPLLDSVDVQLAVRREDYGDLDSTDPKVGINWRITDSLAVRGSWGTSFRAASLGQVVGDDTTAFVAQINDPINGVDVDTNTGTFRTILQAKNPDLEPEESENFNLGVSWAPQIPWGDGSHEFQVDLDYWAFEFENQIRAEDQNAVVQADPCGPQVIRDTVTPLADPRFANQGPTPCPSNVGEVLIVNIGFFNSGKTETNGFDLSAQYSFDWMDSRWSARWENSFISTYDVQVSEGGATIDGAGFRNDGNPGSPTPEWRSNLFLNWAKDRHAANITLRYISEFDDDAFGVRTPGSAFFGEVDAQTEVDVQYSIFLGEDQNYNITIGAINLLDEEPPTAIFEGWVPRVHNPFGRQIYARFGTSL